MGLEKYINLTKTLDKIGEEVKNKYKDKLKKPNKKGFNAIATGKLFNSIDYKIKFEGNSIRLYFVAADYWINVEDGRSAGSKYPPINVIKRWIINKKIRRTPGIEYKIQRKISILGINPRPFYKQVTNNLIKNYRNEIEESLKEDLNNNVVINIKKTKSILQNISSKNITIKSKTI